MIRHASALALVLVIVALPCPVRADAIDELVRATMAKHQIQGAAIAVLHHGREAKRASYGLANVELNVPVRAETVFEIGSITKQFTAAALLLLAEEGKLSLEDRITKHLPAAPAAWSNITIRHLLAHTSGLRNYTGHNGFEMTKRLNQERFIRALAALPRDFEPGEQAKYCNSGYNLLGYIIENASGKSYWSFLAERLWAPLGMSSATNRDPAIVVPHRADGYLRKGGALQNRDSDLTDVFAAGAIVCNMGDLVKWSVALEGEKILSARSRTQMWTAQKLNDGTVTPYGFGWRVGDSNGRKVIGHSGSTSGFSASHQRFPEEKLAVLVLCNSDEPNIATTIAREIATAHLAEARSAAN